MSQFSYVATKKNGESEKGIVEADDQAAALDAVRKLGLHPLSVHPAHKGAGFGSMSIGGKVKVKDLVIFTRQLATLVNAGVPLVRSLSTLQMQSENQTLKKQLGVVVKKVEAGASLGDSLELYPKTFSAIYVNMVKAGEEGGILDEVLNRLAVQQEKDAAIRGKSKVL